MFNSLLIISEINFQNIMKKQNVSNLIDEFTINLNSCMAYSHHIPFSDDMFISSYFSVASISSLKNH